MTDKNLKQECFEKKFYSFGTAKIFERRMKSFSWRLKSITFLGLLLPILIGASVAAFSTEHDWLKNILIPICGILTITQAVLSLLSLLSLVFKWEDNYSYAISALKINTRLTNDFEKLAKEKNEKIENDIDRLLFEYERQETEDTSQGISDKEKRFAMRAALFQYKCKCKTCDLEPKKIKPTDCDTCGNY